MMYSAGRGRAFLSLLFLPIVSAAAAADAPLVIADFEPGTKSAVVAYDDAAAVEPSDSGGHVLRVTPGQGPQAKPGILVRFTDLKLPATGRFRCSLRVASTKPEVTVRWIARRDATSPAARQLRLNLRPEAGWVKADVPLHAWRWGNESVADLSEAAEIVLLVDEAADEVRVDDVRIDPLTNADETPAAWLRRQAFAGAAGVRMVERDGLIVGTDVPPDLMPDASVDRLLTNMARARAFVKRAFGDAVRPVDDGTPPAVLIFREPAGMNAFWERIGKEWAVTVAPPTAGGYTVYDIATSSYDAKMGPERPVFLHEAIHAIVAHDVRLLPGTRHSWLQEGVANYVQLCIYPESLRAGAYSRAFTVPPGEPGSPFKPIELAIGSSNDVRLHGQRATIFGYLLHEQPQWIPVIAKALADGADVIEALRRCDTNPDALGAAWLAWGNRWFTGRQSKEEVHFPLPEEWADERK